ncbi:ACP S-malonyltransferase [Sediminibacillus albus]|uniref:Malonyl CoA-acyl carrier protein transacylase n=1 Tax=Sediminibacillus albus TaxID=407036 RepID=A0A1G8W438_9BACI|nr:ACP S-malonyltransferase [Sediminibacillus albus]SDJ73068.1 [acyl-carrier-protein] S-malonyltransferase [Sediminibacillus albus]
MKRVAFVFPGQGSQDTGMGKDVYENFEIAKKLFDKADQWLDKPLKQLMFEGPKEELTNTENAQPALLLNSAVIDAILKQYGVEPVMTAGHSLGEYSALVSAGAFTLEEALPLVRLRGRLMEQAYPAGRGAMAAVLGGDIENIHRILDEVNESTDQVVDAANYNCPGQVVISGTKQGIEDAASRLKESGIKRVLPLNVSGPFHSRLMQPAAEKFSSPLNEADLSDADIPVYANVTAAPVTNKQTISDLLIKQLSSPVRFQETVENILDQGVDAIVEVGNGKVLTGLVKKINRRTKTFSIQDTESIHTFIEWYKEES